MAYWKVELYNPHLQDWRTKKVRARSRAAAEQQGIEGEAEGWQVDELYPLCAFCEVGSQPAVEANHRVVVIDPADVEDDPDGGDAPTRIAWVCEKHHSIVQSLDTA